MSKMYSTIIILIIVVPGIGAGRGTPAPTEAPQLSKKISGDTDYIPVEDGDDVTTNVGDVLDIKCVVAGGDGQDAMTTISCEGFEDKIFAGDTATLQGIEASLDLDKKKCTCSHEGPYDSDYDMTASLTLRVEKHNAGTAAVSSFTVMIISITVAMITRF